MAIRNSLEQTILRELMPRSQIDVYVQVGAAGTAAGAWPGCAPAPAGALRQQSLLPLPLPLPLLPLLPPRSLLSAPCPSPQVLQADGGTRCAALNAAYLALADAGVPMRDALAACAAGYLDSTPLLDLNYVEDSGGWAQRGSHTVAGVGSACDCGKDCSRVSRSYVEDSGGRGRGAPGRAPRGGAAPHSRVVPRPQSPAPPPPCTSLPPPAGGGPDVVVALQPNLDRVVLLQVGRRSGEGESLLLAGGVGALAACRRAAAPGPHLKAAASGDPRPSHTPRLVSWLRITLGYNHPG